MKLSDWAKKQGIAYLTAYRWFRDGKLPVKAYQSDSGTIIVQDESETSEQAMGNAQTSDVMTTFFLKTVEFSKNNRTVEEFAAWVMSTFTLRFNNQPEPGPKYSKVKPKPEDVQKHFQRFLKPKGDKPKPQMFVAPPEALEEIAEQEGWTSSASAETLASASVDASNIDTVTISDPELKDTLGGLISSGPVCTSVKLYGNVAEGVVTRSVDSTPQLNYTGSEGSTLCNYFAAAPAAAGATMSVVSNNLYNNGAPSIMYANQSDVSTDAYTYSTFGPTQRELESAKSFEVSERPRRGRKPKNSRKQ